MTCIYCKVEKSLSEFYTSKNYKNGFHNRCKECESIYRKQPKRRENKLKYSKRRQTEEYKTYQKEMYFKTRYNITLEKYNQLWEKQNGLCAICGKPETSKHTSGAIYKLSVDHCHTTNEVRGLLCSKCNIGLGQFQDNTNYLLLAAQYLNNYKEKKDEA